MYSSQPIKLQIFFRVSDNTSYDGSCYEPINSSILQNIFSYLEMFIMQCRKNITVEDNKKKNEYSWPYKYIYKYIYLYYMWREWLKVKNDWITSILQHDRVVDKSCCVVFPTSGFPYLTLCPRQCKWKVATTYLALRTKNN